MILASGILLCIGSAAMLLLLLMAVADIVFDLRIPLFVVVAIVAGILGITGGIIAQNDCEAQGYHYIDGSCYKGELEKS